MHQPGIEPGSHRWQRCILPLDHWCFCKISRPYILKHLSCFMTKQPNTHCHKLFQTIQIPQKWPWLQQLQIVHFRWRPYRVECTGSLSTSEVKRRRARLVLGWGTAWEHLRVLSALHIADSAWSSTVTRSSCGQAKALTGDWTQDLQFKKPSLGIEPRTFSLQDWCSATEL